MHCHDAKPLVLPVLQVQVHVLRCITDASLEASEALGPAAACLTKPEQHQQLLALRGLLACDLLLHALQKRHLVEYGRWGGAAGSSWSAAAPAVMTFWCLGPALVSTTF